MRISASLALLLPVALGLHHHHQLHQTQSNLSFVAAVKDPFSYCVRTKNCHIHGDPHFNTFDSNHYTYMGKGEFVLAKSSSPYVNGMQVNGCLKSFSYHAVSYLTSVAFKCGPHIIYADANDPMNAQVYSAGGGGALSTWTSPVSTWNLGTKVQVFKCETDIARKHGTIVHIVYREVSERKTKASVKVINAQIHVDVSATYGTLAGLCNEFPGTVPGSFIGRSGTAVPFPPPPGRIKDSTVFNADSNGPVSWLAAGDSLLTPIGQTCTNGAPTTSFFLSTEEYDYGACSDNQEVADAQKCVAACKALHGLDAAYVEDCVEDVLLQCDTQCVDTETS